MRDARLRLRSGLLVGAVIGSSLILSAPGEAQDIGSAAVVGKKVRLLAPAVVSGRIEGVALEMDQQALVLDLAEGTRLRVLRSTITKLEVSNGRRRHALEGAGIGAATFLLLGVASNLGAARAQDAGLAALVGGLWGAGIGALVEGERWSSVPLNRVAVGDRGPASGLSVTLRF